MSSTPATPTAPTGAPAETGSDHWHLAAAPLWRALVHLCLPMAAGMSVGAIYNIINAGFVGSLHDTTLLAAITFGLPLLGLIMAVGGVFGVGGGTMISRLLGASERDAAQTGSIKHVSSFALWGSVLAGSLAGGLCLLLLDPLVRLLGADAASAPATAAYVGTLLVFMPVLTASFTLEQLVRAEGAARSSMVGLIASTVANLLFDVLFILVLHLGVAGAALGTGLSNVVAVGWFVWFLVRSSEHISLSPRWFTLRPAREVFGVGVGELLQSGFLIVTSLLLNNLAIAYGDAPLAAFGVAMRIVQLPEFLVMGVAIGVLPLLAYSFGAGNVARLRSALKASAVSIGAIVLVFSTAVFLYRDQVFQAFSSDPSVLLIGVTVLTAQLVASVVNGFTVLLTSLFQATGQSVPAMVMGSAQGVVFIPVVMLGSRWFGLTGIIWALTVTELIVFATGLLLFVLVRRSLFEEPAGDRSEPLEAALVTVQA